MTGPGITGRPEPPRFADRGEGPISWPRYLARFRRDIFAAQPPRLFRAWMAEMRAPGLRSFLVNDPAIVAEVLQGRPQAFPKSRRVTAGLRPLLGRSVFVTNGEEWARQRRILDAAFGHGRVAESLPAMVAAAAAMRERLSRLAGRAGAIVELEEQASMVAADIIFRVLFSIPIEEATALRVYRAFRRHQEAQPLLNLGAFAPLPAWVPHFHRPSALLTARHIRRLIAALVRARAEAIARGRAPDDLATRIMTTPDPRTGRLFTQQEMVDQVAIMFLAGHETSAAALAWALWLLGRYPEVRARVRAQARNVLEGGPVTRERLARLTFARDVFREALRLYAPVPMMVREAACPIRFRDREVRPGDQVVISIAHLHRHERIWTAPHAFCPERFASAEGRESRRLAFLPFSAGPRVCPGAAFAMAEGALLLAETVRAFELEAIADDMPRPVARLTVRSADGIRVWLRRLPSRPDR